MDDVRVTNLAGLASRIAALQPGSIVAVSGYGGAGKSTLSRALVEAVPGSIRLRGDDFLDPARSHQRSSDWDGLERNRMKAEVLEPFRLRQPVLFRPFDWDARQLGAPVPLPVGEVLIVDSIAILHPELDGCFDLTVWVDTDLATAEARGAARDRAAGHDHDRLWTDVWVPNDRDFAARFDPRGRADLRFVP